MITLAPDPQPRDIPAHARVGQRSACQRQDEEGWRHRSNSTQPACGRRKTRRRAARRSAARRTARLARSAPGGVPINVGLFDVVTLACCSAHRSSHPWMFVAWCCSPSRGSTPRWWYGECRTPVCCLTHTSSISWMFGTQCWSSRAARRGAARRTARQPHGRAGRGAVPRRAVRRRNAGEQGAQCPPAAARAWISPPRSFARPPAPTGPSLHSRAMQLPLAVSRSQVKPSASSAR